VPDWRELSQRLDQLSARMSGAMTKRLEGERQRLSRLAGSRVLADPVAPIQTKRQLLDWQCQRLVSSMQALTQTRRSRLAGLAGGLDAMSPLKVLARGYALAENEQVHVVRSVSQAELGEQLRVRLSDGSLDCVVMKKRKDEQSCRLKS
jgi:exodeoxyribonuclease VII large subunit